MFYPAPAGAAAVRSNADVDWEKFDPAQYFDANYRSLVREDAEIISLVTEFFHAKAAGRRRSRAIDVGPGTNLYPSMMMLPFTSEILLYERAYSNRNWLVDQLRRPAESWSQFWRRIQQDRPLYHRIDEPMDMLSRLARVVEGDIFSLDACQFDIGTMFFVAESVTSRTDEFRRAIECFLSTLRPTAPFAAAFMRKSSGYSVGDTWFPACSVDVQDVEACVRPFAHIEQVRVVASHDLRPGYDGMIVVCGRRRWHPGSRI